MNAVLTILFLVLIRLWSRSSKSSASLSSSIAKLGDGVEEAGGELVSVVKAADNAIEGDNSAEGKSINKKAKEGLVIDNLSKSIRETSTHQLDAQFFGELLIASLASGAIVKYGGW